MTTQEADDFRRLLADLMTVKAARDQAEAERDRRGEWLLALGLWRERAEHAEATLAAIRAWADQPIPGVSIFDARYELRRQVLALLDAAPKAAADGAGVGGPVTGTT
jgi:hypothetical protein